MSPEEVRGPVQAELPNVETIEGHVARITFRNDDTGYTIFRVDVAGLRDPVSVLGVVDRVAVGEHVTAEGQWENNPQWGRQLRAQRVSVQLPVSRKGTARYLASRLKGIGPKLAERISARFGDEVLQVIDHEPERLLEVPGIGEETLEGIRSAWTGEKRTREVMIWLEDHGLGSARAAAVFRKYGEDAARIVEANPYRLIADIRGIGFAIADNIARTLGIIDDAPMRLQAGLYFVLATARDRDGHCGLPETVFIEEAVKTLGPHELAIRSALETELAEGMLVRVEIEGDPCVFTERIHQQERTIANVLAALQQRPLKEAPIDVPQALAWVQRQTGLRLAPDQERAVETALAEKVAIVTGGPGVGKTTILNSVLRILRAKGLRTHLCAPTGRAARRLSETSGLTAKTIHRLLEFDPNEGRFRRNRDNLLETDVVVVDEVSMVDVPIMAALLQAIPDTARLLLVGDVDQLP
ncbi:MAG: AAA family ATPase, partial [Rhodospirillales bacterium]|nr:AAA family ATPase [Rhodospirillales bacterium]